MTDQPRHSENGSPGPAGADEALLAALLESLDEAAADGRVGTLPDGEPLSEETRRELEQVGRQLALLHQAARAGALSGDQADVASGSLVGESMGRFTILRELGRGGWGVVFLARDESLGRQVALKLPRPEVLVASEMRRRFLREAEAAGRLEHPHLLPIYEVGEDGGLCYLVSPYCRGPTLAEWRARQKRPVPVRDAAQLAAQLAEAVEHAHRFGVMHRDIKPGNVLLDPGQHAADDGTDRPLTSLMPKLTDFGLARLLEAAHHETRSGALLGTPAYMAPEQAGGKPAEVGPATDVYALGVLLYELLAGRPPLVGANDAETLSAILSVEPAPLRRLRADVPRDVEAVVARCLAKVAVERYATAGELAADLRRFLAGQPTRARPLGLARRVVRGVRRNPGRFVVSLVILALLASLVGGGRWYAGQLSDERSARLHRQYARDLREAFAARNRGDLGQARMLLSRYAEGRPGAELRGLEWDWLDAALESQGLTIESGHGEVYTVAFTPDGLLLSGGEDGVIRAWDPRGGAMLYELKGHGACVNQVALSPDGRRLASASCDRSVRLWDLAERRELGRIGNHADEVQCLAFARDKPWLASGAGSRLYVWDTRDGSLVVELDPLAGKVDALAFRGDDALLSAACGSWGWRVWRTEDWISPAYAGSTPRCLAFAGSELVTAGRECAVQIFSPPEIDVTRQYSMPGEVLALAVAPANDRIYAAGDKFGIHVIDRGRDTRQVLACDCERIQALALSADGTQLAAAGWDDGIWVWDLDVQSRTAAPLEAVRSPDIAVGSRFWAEIYPVRNTLAIRDTTDHRVLSTKVSVSAVGGIPAGEQFCLGRHNSKTNYSLLRLPSLETVPGFENMGDLQTAALSGDGSTIALLDRDGVLRIVETKSARERLRTRLDVDATIARLALDDAGGLLAIVELGRPLEVISTRTGSRVAVPEDLHFLGERPFFPGALSISPDGELTLFLRDNHPHTTMSRVRTGEHLYDLNYLDRLSQSVAWSPDGRRLAFLTRQGEVVLFDAHGGEELGVLDSLTGIHLYFSDDGALTTISDDPSRRWHTWRPHAARAAREKDAAHSQ